MSENAGLGRKSIEPGTRGRGRTAGAQRFSRQRREKILLENYFFLTHAETCRKWGITAAMLRRWKRELCLGDGPAGGFRDWLVAGLYSGSATIPALADYLDWVNHCR